VPARHQPTRSEARRGELDDLDPGPDLLVRDLLYQVGMVRPYVVADRRDDFVVGLASADVAALAFHLLRDGVD